MRFCCGTMDVYWGSMGTMGDFGALRRINEGFLGVYGVLLWYYGGFLGVNGDYGGIWGSIEGL